MPSFKSSCAAAFVATVCALLATSAHTAASGVSPVLHPPSSSTVYNTTAPIYVASPGSYTDRFKAIPAFWGFSLSDNETHLGMQAAFHEANAAGGIHGRPLKAVPSTANLEHVFYNMTNITLVAGSVVSVTQTTSRLAQASKVPLLGTRSTSLSAFASGATEFLHVRTSFESEVMSLLNYAVHSHLKCKRFLIFHVPFADMVAVAYKLRDVIIRLGLPAPKLVQTTLVQDTANYGPWRSTLPAILDNMTAAPHGVFLLMDGSTAKHVVELYSKSRRFVQGDMHFFTGTFASEQRFVDSTGSSAVFRNLYLSMPYPFANDRRFAVVQQYQAAMAALQSSGENDVRMSGVPSFFSLDGYLSGRAIIATAKTMQPTNMSAAAFKERFFEQRMFSVADAVFGPYSAGCVGQQAATSATACWCNTGARTQYLVTVDPATGLQREVLDDSAAGEDGVAQLTTALERCGVGADMLVPSFVLPAFFDAAHAAAVPGWASQSGEAFARGLQSALQAGLIAELLREKKASRMPRGVVEGVQTNLTTVTAAGERYSVFAAALSVAPATAQRGATHLSFAPLPPDGRFLDRDPDTVPHAQHEPNVIALLPTLADFLHTGAAYAASVNAAASVATLCDTSALCSLAARSVESFGHPAAASEVLPDPNLPTAASPTATAADAASDSAIMAALERVARTVGRHGVVLVATHHPSVVRGVVAAARSGALSGATVVVCASELALYAALDGTGGARRVAVPSPPPTGGRVLFASAIPAGVGLPANDGLAAYGQLVARAVMAVYAHETSTSGTAAATAAFQFGSLSSGGVTLEPLSKTSCGLTAPVYPHPGGTCQCVKGLNTFALFAHSNASSSTLTPSFGVSMFQYRHAGCGVKYTPLPSSSSSLSPAVVAAISCGAALIVIVAVVIVGLVLLRPKGRDTKNAPKAPEMPFAVAFTDIQASTTLWALAPEHMGAAVDEHHRVMRLMVKQHKGYEVKTIGDSFMVAFDDPQNAAAFAVATQAALHEAEWGTPHLDTVYDELLLDQHPSLLRAVRSCAHTHLWSGLRVRVGVHYGCGQIVLDATTQGYDYYGTVVNTAARVEGVGHGGQVLLTEAAFDAISLPNLEKVVGQVKSVALGPQPLRGLPDDVGLVQLLPMAFADRQFPPLRLDVEVTVDFDSESARDTTSQQSATPGQRQTSDTYTVASANGDYGAFEDFDALAQRLLRAKSAPSSMLFLVDKALETLMAPDSAMNRASAVQKWSQRWRIDAAVPRRLSSLPKHSVGRLRLAAKITEAMAAAGVTMMGAEVIGLEARRRTTNASRFVADMISSDGRSDGRPSNLPSHRPSVVSTPTAAAGAAYRLPDHPRRLSATSAPSAAPTHLSTVPSLQL